MSIKVDIQYAVDKKTAGLPVKRQFEAWVRAALAGRRKEAELAIRIVGQEEGAMLNETYRGRRGSTNVLSFPFESPKGITLPLLGDIVICAPVVEREAREQGKGPVAHWAHLTVHGTLHLLGYDHIKTAEAKVMEDLETSILLELGYPDPYAVETAARAMG